MDDIYAISEVKLTYSSKVKASERPVIKCSRDIYKLLISAVFDMETIEHHESLKLILMNRAGRVLGVTTISQGGLAETSADMRIILQAAILGNASGIILSHNHPSGGKDIQPSVQDDLLTQKVSKICKLMDLNMLDHIIVTTEGYYSYADEGRLS